MANRRILIANRGEIAIRVARAAREMGHIPLAIYSKADRQCLHLSKCDEAYCVGEGPSIQSYLNVDNVIAAAKAMRADAVHPGYGFLSENPTFAKAVEKAGLVFIGPPADIIGSMGDKVKGRQTMEKVGLPPIPGTPGGFTDENSALKEANRIGYPLMIKALAGGGGRGMRLVEKEAEFLGLFRRAHSEASKAFGDGTLYLEKFINSPHHVEVQIMADGKGNVCHLFERECSVQRRHQKVIEESPSPFLTQATREKICEAAAKASQAVGYLNAGTIEFLVDGDQNFYFMEMNTRLQVEHPVTEWVTGIDLVKEQIRVAFGQKLSFHQEEVQQRGHSMEFRIYAEDPQKFLPQAGMVTGVSFPHGPGIRIDSHIYRGYTIPVFYDSMIAKFSTWGKDRAECVDRSRAALQDTIINGIKTNVPLHLQLLQNKTFLSGNYTTHLMQKDFQYQEPEIDPEVIKMAVMSVGASAFAKEFQGLVPLEDENSRWKSTARTEALQ